MISKLNQTIQKFKVTVWYTAPTAIRLLMKAGVDRARREVEAHQQPPGEETGELRLGEHADQHHRNCEVQHEPR